MNKTVLITGATGTIGKATALEVAKSGVIVVLLSRNKDKLESVKTEISQKSGNDNIEILVADFSDIFSVKNAVNEFKQKYNKLDVLINVAAVYKRKREISKDRLELMFAINHLAPFILTNELLDLLKTGKPGRIITVTAPSVTLLNFDDLQGQKKFSSLNSFGASKMMNLLFTYSLAQRLKCAGVTATAFHPGLVKSELTREMPFLLRYITGLIAGKPDKAAKMLCSLALDSKYEDSNGKFYKSDGKEIKSGKYSYDKEVQKKLWTISEQLSIIF
jgi:NAD(P)-dependent dehydrogenase (short-subunit alcohol dehydrogenase family)